MQGKLRSLVGWRLLAVGLIVVLGLSMFGSWLLLRVPTASAASTTVTYAYLAGSGLLCGIDPSLCPDVASAPNGDTITLAGGGTLSIHPDSVTGGGTYSSATVVGMGTWTAKQLLSFISYGTSPGFPPTFEGGKALVSIHLSPTTGGPGFDAVLRITCLIGSPPPSANEGIRLDVQDVINLNEEVSGGTLFIRTSPQEELRRAVRNPVFLG